MIVEQSKREKELEAKRAAILERLNIAEAIAIDGNRYNTGAQLRSERKTVLRRKLKHEKTIALLKGNARATLLLKGDAPSKGASSTSTMTKKPPKNKFVLQANIAECISAFTIVELVRATAPYIVAPDQLVMDDEDDDDDDDNSDDNGHGDSTKKIVENSLAAMAHDPQGWEKILLSTKITELLPNTEQPTEVQRIDYFALCLASHFATSASYAPIDVTANIIDYCWLTSSPVVLEKQFEVLKSALHWDAQEVGRRSLKIKPVDAINPFSPHDGDMMGVLVGAIGAFGRNAMVSHAMEAEELLRHGRLYRVYSVYSVYSVYIVCIHTLYTPLYIVYTHLYTYPLLYILSFRPLPRSPTPLS